MSGTLIQILIALGALLGLGGMFMRNQANQRKAGEDAQKARDAAAGDDARRRMEDAQAHGPRDGDGAIDRLRKHDA